MPQEAPINIHVMHRSLLRSQDLSFLGSELLLLGQNRASKMEELSLFLSLSLSRSLSLTLALSLFLFRSVYIYIYISLSLSLSLSLSFSASGAEGDEQAGGGEPGGEDGGAG